MRLDPISLRLFIAIVETGTIMAAAEREHVAASAISRRIRDLEDQLRTPLLVRTNKGVEATPAGLALVNLARNILNSLDDLAAQIGEFSQGVRGQVRVAANPSAITQFLPGDIKHFLAGHPHVQIHLEERISTRVIKAVAENQADLGIYTAAPHGQEVESFPYRHDRLVLITARDHPLAVRDTVRFAETLEYDFVGLHTGSTIDTALRKAASELDRVVRVRIQVTSYEALCLMVETGLGIGFLPEAVARRYLGPLGIRLIHLDEAWTHRELRVCVRAYDALPVAARLLVDHLRGPGTATA